MCETGLTVYDGTVCVCVCVCVCHVVAVGLAVADLLRPLLLLLPSTDERMSEKPLLFQVKLYAFFSFFYFLLLVFKNFTIKTMKKCLVAVLCSLLAPQLKAAV